MNLPNDSWMVSPMGKTPGGYAVQLQDESLITHCMRAECSAQFTSHVVRKHICKGCGNVFCGKCSSSSKYIVNGQTKKHRLCVGCAKKFSQDASVYPHNMRMKLFGGRGGGGGGVGEEEEEEEEESVQENVSVSASVSVTSAGVTKNASDFLTLSYVSTGAEKPMQQLQQQQQQQPQSLRVQALRSPLAEVSSSTSSKANSSPVARTQSFSGLEVVQQQSSFLPSPLLAASPAAAANNSCVATSAASVVVSKSTQQHEAVAVEEEVTQGTKKTLDEVATFNLEVEAEAETDKEFASPSSESSSFFASYDKEASLSSINPTDGDYLAIKARNQRLAREQKAKMMAAAKEEANEETEELGASSFSSSISSSSSSSTTTTTTSAAEASSLSSNVFHMSPTPTLAASRQKSAAATSAEMPKLIIRMPKLSVTVSLIIVALFFSAVLVATGLFSAARTSSSLVADGNDYALVGESSIPPASSFIEEEHNEPSFTSCSIHVEFNLNGKLSSLAPSASSRNALALSQPPHMFQQVFRELMENNRL